MEEIYREIAVKRGADKVDKGPCQGEVDAQIGALGDLKVKLNRGRRRSPR